jgi:lipoyl(octanoyl) transferase 2
LLVEHPSTFTLGRRFKESKDQLKLKEIGADFQFSQRGGQITYHGPGQLVGYPILHLKEYQLGARCYVNRMEQVVIDLLKKYAIHGTRTENTGIWVNNEKICAIGIHIQRHITSHGFGLNCNTDLQWFNHIVPCGLPFGVTSISKELNQNVTIDEVTPLLIDSFSAVFKTTMVPLDELDDLLDKEIDKFLTK